jgi:hypothetical protein
MSTAGLPKGWREGTMGELACPHRDVSVCPECDAAHPEAVDVYGAHFWIADPADRAGIADDLANIHEATVEEAPQFSDPTDEERDHAALLIGAAVEDLTERFGISVHEAVCRLLNATHDMGEAARA